MSGGRPEGRPPLSRDALSRLFAVVLNNYGILTERFRLETCMVTLLNAAMARKCG